MGRCSRRHSAGSVRASVEIKQISPPIPAAGMNGNSHAHISEHAFGKRARYRRLHACRRAAGHSEGRLEGGLPEEQGFLRDVEAAACQQFSTVLAPGSNAYHTPITSTSI